MKRFLTSLLSMGILTSFLIYPIKISATTMVNFEQQAIEECMQIITKDMITGEVSSSSFSYPTRKNGRSITRNVYPAWYPESIAPIDSNISILADGIIGEDDREKISNTKRFPYSAICYLEAYWGSTGETYCGTAWMINDNIAITAGHCVYRETLNGMADSVTVWPGKNGDGFFGREPYGSAVKTIVQAPDWINSEENPCYDWALIVLDSPIGEETGWLGFGCDEEDFMGIEVSITGYPDGHNCKQYRASGYISAYDDYRLYHDIDSTKGQSGAPVYTYEYVSYGIETRTINSSVNSSVRINQGMFYFFEGYINNY